MDAILCFLGKWCVPRGWEAGCRSNRRGVFPTPEGGQHPEEPFSLQGPKSWSGSNIGTRKVWPLTPTQGQSLILECSIFTAIGILICTELFRFQPWRFQRSLEWFWSVQYGWCFTVATFTLCINMPSCYISPREHNDASFTTLLVCHLIFFKVEGGCPALTLLLAKGCVV